MHCAPQRHDPLALAFSQVCTQWRHLALEDPRLWTRPIVSRPRLAQEMLRRAKNLPLIVECTIGSKEHYQFLTNMILQHGDTFRTFRYNGRLPYTLPLPKKLPLLEHLEVVGPGDRTNMFDCPPDIEAPSLRILKLNSYFPPLGTSLLSGLTTLEIINNSYDSRIRVELSDVIKMLHGNPHLTNLTLREVLRDDESVHDIGQQGVVTLSQLTSLCIVDQIFTTIQLLSRLRMPALDGLGIQDTSEVTADSRGQDIRDIVDCLCSTLRAAGKHRARYMDWSIDHSGLSETDLEMSLWDASKRHEWAADGIPATLYLDLCFNDGATAGEFLEHFARVLPLEDLVGIDASNNLRNPELCAPFWAQISTLPSLRVARFDSAIPSQLFAGDTMADERGALVQTQSLPFPNLRALSLRKIMLDKRYRETTKTVHEHLVSALDVRERLTGVSPKVSFDRCNSLSAV